MPVLIGWPGGSLSAFAALFGLLLGGYVLVLWLATILWAYRDIRERSRDPIAQLIGVVLVTVFPVVGVVLYLIVRPDESLRDIFERELEEDALLFELRGSGACPSCRRPVSEDFLHCPHCRTVLRDTCRACGRSVSVTWRACAYCGSVLREQAPSARRRPPVQEAPSTVGGLARRVRASLQRDQDLEQAGETPTPPRRRTADDPPRE